MKSIAIIPTILAVALLSSCEKDPVIGSGRLTSEFRNVDYFTQVSSEGVFEINIIQGTSQSVEIIANDNIMHKVKSKVVNNELWLYLEDDESYQNITLKANIVATRLNGINNSGTGDIFAANVSEDGEFSIKNSGTGNLFIDGIASSLDIKNEGTGNIHGFDFSVGECKVDIEGTGDVEISCADYLDVTIEGSGNVYYKGQPAIDTAISGSGSVINAN